jgi:metallo-beta-lactamase family protein
VESFISASANPLSMRLEFHGAASGVTGSHLVLDNDGFRIGIDAGLFQGGEGKQNRSGFGHDPRSLEALLLTHAHIDHSGRVPLLVKQGFRGPIYSTPATVDLCEIMLKDSAHIMEEEAKRESRNGGDRNEGPSAPLFTEEDVVWALRRFKPVEYGRRVEMGGLSVVFREAGHILGSAMPEISLGKQKLILSGDLGRPGAPFLCDPEQIAEADWLVLESTYGDREHADRADKAGRGKRLLEIVLDTVERGGNVVIPAFAVGRTQEILYELNPYAEAGKLKGIKCFVDSPLAISATAIYQRHAECFDSETSELLRHGDDPLVFPGTRYTRSREDSKAINSVKEPHIVISANGMATGGRVLYHLAHNLERPESTILFVGYQAEGTLGRQLLSGAKTGRIMGREFDVRARIESLDEFSAHADRSEILEWLRGFKRFPAQVFLNHGELDATEALAQTIRQEFEADVVVAKTGESYVLD